MPRELAWRIPPIEKKFYHVVSVLFKLFVQAIAWRLPIANSLLGFWCTIEAAIRECYVNWQIHIKEKCSLVYLPKVVVESFKIN